MTELEDRLVQAAEAAIRNERPSIEHPTGHVLGVTIELALTSTGQVCEAIAYVERRTRGGAHLARHTGRGPAT